MLEAIRAEILRPDMLVDGKPIDQGAVLEFSDLTAFEDSNHPQERLLLESYLRANRVHATGWGQPRDTFSPQGTETGTRWEMSFGTHPLQRSTVIFGTPGNVQATYLGHRERDRLGPVITNQQTLFQPEMAVGIDTIYPDYRGVLVAASPVFNMNLYGIEGDNRETYTPEDGFSGKCMYVAEVWQWQPESSQKEPDLEIVNKLVTIADADGLLRVLEPETRERGKLSERTTQNTLARLARVNLAFQYFSQHPETRWMKKGFPLQMISGIRQYVEEAMNPGRSKSNQFRNDWGPVLQERYGVDLHTAFTAVPAQAVAIETERITDAIKSHLE